MGHLLTNVAEYAILLDEKNKKVLLVQWGEKGDIYDYTWHFPGGRLDQGEKEIEGLRRELKEELDVEVEHLRLVYTKYVALLKGHPIQPRYAVFYTAKLKEGAQLQLNTEELNRYKWFTKKELQQLKYMFPFYKNMLEEVLPF